MPEIDSSFLRTLDFNGARVLVKSAIDDNLSFNTAIVEHNKAYQTINVALNEEIPWDLSKLLVIVFANSKVYQFDGTGRKNATQRGSLEIAIYKASEKEDRKQQRYDVNINANVDAVLIDNYLLDLKIPMQTTILNVSNNGLMFKAMSGAFRPKDILRLTAPDMDNTIFYVSIVRKNNIDLLTANYGCKLVTI